MFNPDQVRRLRDWLAANPGASNFEGYWLTTLRIGRSSRSLQCERPVLRGNLFPPARVFGVPVRPACMDDIKACAIGSFEKEIVTARSGRIVGFNAMVDGDLVLFAPEDTRFHNRWSTLVEANKHGHHGFLVVRSEEDLAITFGSRLQPRFIPMNAVFFHNVEPGNYGSFIFRQLPQLLFAKACSVETDCYIVAERTPWLMEAMSMLGLPERPIFAVREVSGDTFKSIRMFHVPDAEGFLAAETKSWIASLVDAVFSSGHRASPPLKRIYVSRALSSLYRPWYRQMLNELEVEQAMRRAGFAVVYPETLSFKKQIAAFASANRVIGPSGSGMFNTVFARSPPRIVDVETFHVTIRQHAKFYASCDAQYAFAFATPDQDDEKPMLQRRWRLSQSVLEPAVQWLAA